MDNARFGQAFALVLNKRHVRELSPEERQAIYANRTKIEASLRDALIMVMDVELITEGQADEQPSPAPIGRLMKERVWRRVSELDPPSRSSTNRAD